MVKCVWCESVYESEESTASEKVKTAVCSKECEEKFNEWSNEPLEFVCRACIGKGFFFNDIKGYEEECIGCNGTGKEYSIPIK